MLAPESLGQEIVVGSADELLARVAEELRRLRVRVDDAPVAVHDEDAIGRRLAELEPPLGGPALAQVSRDLCKTDEVAGGVPHRRDDDVGPEP